MKKKIAIISMAIFLIDQIVKVIVSVTMSPNSSITIIPGFFNITYLTNTGGAWSILNNHLLILIIVSIGALIGLIIYSKSFIKSKKNAIIFGLVFGGILGNLFDRVIHAYVIDYLDFTIFNYNYPVFNLADISLVIGVFLLIIAIFKGEDKNEVSSK